jgi:ABC-2 type transport system ATP-binding protein
MAIHDVAIKVDNVSKTFKLPHEKQASIKGALINLVHGGKRSYETQQALKGISFEVKKGEFFGIVGRNGSGKSTLLKMLAGTYMPSKGSIHVNGKLTPFIELGVGFNPELTGRENVFLNGALLGFNRKEMMAMYEDIVDFAEIERFMDQKLKNYSSGMQVRLAFSIAIRADSDILLFDEVLAVGDASFQQKCYDMFENLKKEGRTVVLVTHDMSAVQRFCQRAILIEKGVIQLNGKPGDIADKYLEQNFEKQVQSKDPKGEPRKDSSMFTVKNVKLKSPNGSSKSFSMRENVTVGFSVKNHSTEESFHIGLQIFNGAGAYCFGTNTKISNITAIKARSTNISLSLSQTLAPGTYFVTIAIMNNAATKVLRYLPKLATFNVKQETEDQGVVLMDYKWEVANV